MKAPNSLAPGAARVWDALSAAGWDPSRASDDTMILVAVGDNGDDDPEAVAYLAEIRAIIQPLGWVADWTGSGASNGDGESTSDVGITPSEDRS